MRINSPFHDYYDCIQAHGVDQNLVYVRKPEVVKGEVALYFAKGAKCRNLFLPYWSNRRTIDVYEYIIGFCGKLTPMLWVCKSCSIKEENAFCYTLEDVDNFVETHFKKREIKCYHNTEKVYRKYQWDHSQRRFHFEEYFRLAEDEKNKPCKLFRKHNAPIFISRYSGRSESSHITYNGSLKDVEFYRIVDPYTAYQELQMYLTGVLGLTDGHRPKYQGQLIEPDLDDITKRDSKGFDKWSFRKEPEKK